MDRTCTNSVKRRSPGISTNICVHKYFFETSPIWRQVREEEEQAKKELQQEPPEEADDVDDEELDPSAIQFDPIDSRHLSSLPLIQSRITRLLQNSPHGLHAATNLLIRIVSFMCCDYITRCAFVPIRMHIRDSPNPRRRIADSSLHASRSLLIRVSLRKSSSCERAKVEVWLRCLAFGSPTRVIRMTGMGLLWWLFRTVKKIYRS